eukprot:6843737-Alexandrium_andersonii.AAC.1
MRLYGCSWARPGKEPIPPPPSAPADGRWMRLRVYAWGRPAAHGRCLPYNPDRSAERPPGAVRRLCSMALTEGPPCPLSCTASTEAASAARAAWARPPARAVTSPVVFAPCPPRNRRPAL